MPKNELIKSERETTFNRILQFMTDGDITLTAEDEIILSRWTYAFKLFIQNKYTEEQICEKVKDIFSVSIYTARNDKYQAQALFAGSIKSNKKLLLHRHAESIRLFMEKCKTDKSLIHLIPKLAEAYTKAVIAIPDEINKDVMHPPVMNFFLIPGQDVKVNKTFEDALADMKSRQDDSYTEFQEVKDSND
jgi:hypothetical protein